MQARRGEQRRLVDEGDGQRLVERSEVWVEVGQRFTFLPEVRNGEPVCFTISPDGQGAHQKACRIPLLHRERVKRPLLRACEVLVEPLHGCRLDKLCHVMVDVGDLRS